MIPPAGDEVHLWRGSLDALPWAPESLSRQERERADAFRFPRDRRRFAAGRAALRTALGSYLGVAPRAVELSATELGKPFLRGGELQFNLSHSEHHVVLAVTRDIAVGIDVEAFNSVTDTLSVARRFFSRHEHARLLASPPALRDHAFLECWTRKEAVLKARGDGLSLALDSFDVGFAGAPCAVLRMDWPEADRVHWHLEDVSDPGGAYVGALAGRCTNVRLKELDFRTMSPAEPTCPGSSVRR